MKLTNLGWNIDNSYEKLPEIFYSKLEPNPVSSPKLVLFNQDLAEELGFDIEKLQRSQSIDILAGNRSIEGRKLLAQAYAGHQFGHFTMLGDGRAMLIGEHITPKGERVDIQLKGSGITPYSRGGDGRAALGPMLREYIVSEAIYHLGIPTTRSLAVVSTGNKVYRESPLEGGILTRVAKSHIRVGTFQYASSWGTKEDLKILADYTINRHFPSIKEDENPYLSLLNEVIKLQAELISKWQLVGFIHGVMNTDNMTIIGETIDYGPCAFMDTYNLLTVFSSIDRKGRYSYGNQPNIGAWNLARFAETLLPLISKSQKEAIEIAEKSIDNYFNLYDDNWIKGMRLKLGILNEEKEDKDLIEELLKLMEKYESDFTNTFIGLTMDNKYNLDLFKIKEFQDWNNRWKTRLERQEISQDLSRETMKKHNPIIIPRNHQVEKALKSAVEEGDYTIFKSLLNALSTPFNYDEIDEEYMKPPKPSKVPYKTFCGT